MKYAQVALPLEAAATATPPVDMLDYCPVAPRHAHHAVKVVTPMSTDPSWWCAFCGRAGLPQPDRKAWE